MGQVVGVAAVLAFVALSFERVLVRFDPADQTVVLVRVDSGEQRRIQDEQRRTKEAALLRGGG